MNFAGICLAVALLCLIEALAPTGLRAASTAPIRPVPKVFKDIPYAGTATDERRQNFDLYLPAKSVGKPPLLIFIHGGFWQLTDDDYRIGPSVAENLVQDGVAVALVRYRLAPQNRHPTQAQDIAVAVAHLFKSADKFGYDARRIFIAGHSAGGHLASLVALDRSYLNRHAVAPNSLAGVITVSGIYDLAPAWDVSKNQADATQTTFGKDPAVLKQASPLTHARGDAPPFLIITAAQDLPGLPMDARRFAGALRSAGNKEVNQLMAKGADHFTIVKLDDQNNAVRRTILGFMGVKAPPAQLADWIAAKRVWSNPPYSTQPLWKHAKLVRSYSIDERFVAMLLFIYRARMEELLEWPLKQFHAIDLFAYLDALPKEQAGEGDYIALNSVRGEEQVWRRAQIERYKPVIVVGVDDEKNLFRFSTFYQMYHEYSWKPGGPTAPLAMTLGAFVYFLDKPPPELRAQSWHFGMTEESFRRSKDDPLAAIRGVPKNVEEALTFRNGCVYCHKFRGVGARSHHVHVMTGKPQGGFALPLESYPPEVWNTFMFDQESVAKKMGATPNVVQESARQALFDLVNRSRQEQAPPAQK